MDDCFSMSCFKDKNVVSGETSLSINVPFDDRNLSVILFDILEKCIYFTSDWTISEEDELNGSSIWSLVGRYHCCLISLRFCAFFNSKYFLPSSHSNT